MSVGECVWSLFYFHNETGNVWTHVVGVAVFVALGIQDSRDASIEQHHRVVSAAYCGATTLCMAFSAAFHLLQPNSKRTYDQMLKVDMSGIAIVIIASIQVTMEQLHKETRQSQPHKTVTNRPNESQPPEGFGNECLNMAQAKARIWP